MTKLNDYVDEICNKLGITGVPKDMITAQFLRVVGEIRKNVDKQCNHEIQKEIIQNWFNEFVK